MRFYDVTDKHWVWDLETNGLQPDTIWCLGAINVTTGEEVVRKGHDEIRSWLVDRVADNSILVGHNIIAYDTFWANRILGTSVGVGRLVDTQVMSLCYSPSLAGGHSLAEWGIRLKHPKGEFNDFSALTDEMVGYCLNDCRLTRLVYLSLIDRLRSVRYSELSLDIEHRAWLLIQNQRRAGFPFNQVEANILYAKLRGIENDIRDELYVYYPPKLCLLHTFSRAYRKDGTRSANYLRHLNEYEKLEDTPEGGYRAYGYVAFNIGSPDQRVERLLELGWVPAPDERTPTGRPRPTIKGHLVPSLQRFVDANARPEPALIARWMDINARANMINTWIEAYDDRDGRIHGSLWMANTLRYTHASPNTANIPAVRHGPEGPLRDQEGVFTYESRDLWTCSDLNRRRLVGVDAKGIQLRVLAHYLNNPAFTEALLAGDPHTYNQSIGGFASRAIAKTFLYAYLLGAGDAKVGQIIGDTQVAGKVVKAKFINNFPGLLELMKDLERQIERTSRITLCDGAQVIVDQPHARLGYLLQGDESRIMKKAAILVAQEIYRQGWDAVKVGDIHDEHQYDVALTDIEAFKEYLPIAFAKAGEFFNYRLPIECSINEGLTWATTH